MQHYLQFALQKLQQSGLKVTRPRSLIVELLAASEKALTPYEMKEVFKKKRIKADVVTIYRVLEVLEKLGLVHKVLALHGYVACKTAELLKKGCHHYLLCQKCHRVEEVEGEDLYALQKKIASLHGFSIQSHYLEFLGTCKGCQAGS